MELAPNDGHAKFNFGTQLATFGEVERAIDLTRQAIRRAIELQPAAESCYQPLAIIEIQRGHAQ